MALPQLVHATPLCHRRGERADQVDRCRDVTGIRCLKAEGLIPASGNENRAATTILTAITGGASLLQATDDMSYLHTGLMAALRWQHASRPSFTATPAITSAASGSAHAHPKRLLTRSPTSSTPDR